METDTTIPSTLMSIDSDIKPPEEAKSHPILIVVIAVTVFLIVFLLLRR
ncbi:MAG: hypothetical protein WCG50_15355 [Rhodoferax sp.]